MESWEANPWSDPSHCKEREVEHSSIIVSPQTVALGVKLLLIVSQWSVLPPVALGVKLLLIVSQWSVLPPVALGVKLLLIVSQWSVLPPVALGVKLLPPRPSPSNGLLNRCTPLQMT